MAAERETKMCFILTGNIFVQTQSKTINAPEREVAFDGSLQGKMKVIRFFIFNYLNYIDMAHGCF